MGGTARRRRVGPGRVYLNRDYRPIARRFQQFFVWLRGMVRGSCCMSGNKSYDRARGVRVRLVPATVFKTAERYGNMPLVGSIPMRSRHFEPHPHPIGRSFPQPPENFSWRLTVRAPQRAGWVAGARGARLHVPRWAARRFRGTSAFQPPLPRPPQVSLIRAQSLGRQEISSEKMDPGRGPRAVSLQT